MDALRDASRTACIQHGDKQRRNELYLCIAKRFVLRTSRVKSGAKRFRFVFAPNPESRILNPVI
jgi:hypothetical protein